MSRAFEPRLDVLPTLQRRLWPRLTEVPNDFVLYGGTALALRLGHRRSMDFDFFSGQPFVPGVLGNRLGTLGRGRAIQSATDTLVIEAGGTRLAFFGGLDIAVVAEPDRAANGVLIASLDDLAATKLKVILDRAEARDYLDLAALLEHGLPLERIVGDARAVFGPTFNAMLALRALTSFDEPGLGDVTRSVRDRLRSASAAVRAIPDVATIRDRL